MDLVLERVGRTPTASGSTASFGCSQCLDSIRPIPPPRIRVLGWSRRAPEGMLAPCDCRAGQVPPGKLRRLGPGAPHPVGREWIQMRYRHRTGSPAASVCGRTPNTVELTVKSWQAVGYFALSPCGRG